VLQEDEWVAAFSPRGDLLATGSGNGDGDDPQLVVFNVSSGKTVLNSRLSGLAKALRAAMGLIFVWTVEFV
jgi:outer membrane protein assembly factor BamB